MDAFAQGYWSKRDLEMEGADGNGRYDTGTELNDIHYHAGQAMVLKSHADSMLSNTIFQP